MLFSFEIILLLLDLLAITLEEIKNPVYFYGVILVVSFNIFIASIMFVASSGKHHFPVSHTQRRRWDQ
jgi:hypothetical protein